MRHMRIGIDVSVLDINQAGSAVYAAGLINALKKIIHKEELVFFSAGHIRDMSTKKTVRSRMETLYRDMIWTHIVLPYQSQKRGIDILHMPANICPIYSHCPIVVTIFDITSLVKPQDFPPWHRNYARCIIPLSAKKASVILTISQHSKNDIVKRLNVGSEKIIVTYCGVSEEFKPQYADEIEEVKKKYNINPFILSVGSLEPRKNIVRLLEAYSILRSRGFALPLVHVGPRGWLCDEIDLCIKELGLTECVKFLGHVPLRDLVKLYNAATVFVYPSLYEGFGLPVIEAMACGCPVITSNTSSLPEVAGDAGILIDPLDIKQIADAIGRVSTDRALRQQMTHAGIERARLFSWEGCAKKTLEGYEKASSLTTNIKCK